MADPDIRIARLNKPAPTKGRHRLITLLIQCGPTMLEFFFRKRQKYTRNYQKFFLNKLMSLKIQKFEKKLTTKKRNINENLEIKVIKLR